MPINNGYLYNVQVLIYMCLLTITCLHNKAAVVIKTTAGAWIIMRIMQLLTLHDTINLSTPFLQAYQHQLASFSPFRK